jgi:hypothetical protein
MVVYKCDLSTEEAEAGGFEANLGYTVTHCLKKKKKKKESGKSSKGQCVKFFVPSSWHYWEVVELLRGRV